MTTAAVATDTFAVFGTTAVLLVTDPRVLEAARALADSELAAVDLACSRFRPDSELTALNLAAAGGRADGGTVVRSASGLFADLVDAALRAARLTGGAVDPTCGAALAGLGYDRDFAQVKAANPARRTAAAPVPGWRGIELDRAGRLVRVPAGTQLDLGATAKAWAADRCAELIAGRLGGGVLVSLGGDIAVAGTGPSGGWRVRVTDDHAAAASAPGQTVAISQGGLATSSTTVRTWLAGGRPAHHIIDPATGEPAASCWRTASVAAGSCVDANAASTAAIVMGARAPGWLRAAGLPARLVRPDGTVATIAGWPGDDGRPGPA